jgi:hypothetical protein
MAGRVDSAGPRVASHWREPKSSSVSAAYSIWSRGPRTRTASRAAQLVVRPWRSRPGHKSRSGNSRRVLSKSCRLVFRISSRSSRTGYPRAAPCSPGGTHSTEPHRASAAKSGSVAPGTASNVTKPSSGRNSARTALCARWRLSRGRPSGHNSRPVAEREPTASARLRYTSFRTTLSRVASSASSSSACTDPASCRHNPPPSEGERLASPEAG